MFYDTLILQLILAPSALFQVRVDICLIFTCDGCPILKQTNNANQPGGLTDKNQNYWAKGTGFGTGSTTSGWNVEEALIRQKAEEEHVTCLLKVE